MLFWVIFALVFILLLTKSYILLVLRIKMETLLISFFFSLYTFVTRLYMEDKVDYFDYGAIFCTLFVQHIFDLI